MSAWLCSEDHINVLVNASGNPTEKDFNMLVAENIRSLTSRYPGRDFLGEWVDDAAEFRFKTADPEAVLSLAIVRKAARMPSKFRPDLPKEITPKVLQTQIVKACNCYDYQACETNDYRETEAAKYIDKVRERAVAAGGLTEGKLYDSLLWGID